jgi:hypothetical protein
MKLGHKQLHYHDNEQTDVRQKSCSQRGLVKAALGKKFVTIKCYSSVNEVGTEIELSRQADVALDADLH